MKAKLLGAWASRLQNHIRLALITTFAMLLVATSTDVYGQMSVEGSMGGDLKVARSTDAFSCSRSTPCCRESCQDCAGAFAPRLRGALAASDQPAMGLRPLIQPGGYERGYPARFPRARAWLVPASPHMTTVPVPPMPTYTTRGPRDFFHPKPPSIGY